MIIALITLCWASGFAGSLEPLNPPGSTMKTLDQVQPWTDIQTLAGDANATYIINKSGAYYLTSNIVGENGKNGINVMASGVSINLNGFSLIGVSGSLTGIYFEEDTRDGSVNNGMVRNWGQNGIDASNLTAVRVTDIISDGNGAYGIKLGSDGLASKCLVRENSEWGIAGQNNCLILDCVARDNGFGGFRLFSGGIIKDCVAEANTSVGISMHYEGSVKNCLVSFNGTGIILEKSGNDVRNNSCISNYTNGILLKDKRNRVDSNMVATRSSGTGIKVEESSGSNILLRNTVVLDGSAVAYDIPPGSGATYGPIVDVTGTGDISAVSNANHPWANFVH